MHERVLCDTRRGAVKSFRLSAPMALERFASSFGPDHTARHVHWRFALLGLPPSMQVVHGRISNRWLEEEGSRLWLPMSLMGSAVLVDIADPPDPTDVRTLAAPRALQRRAFRSVAVQLLAFAASRSDGCEAPERRGIRGACRFRGHTQSARYKRNGTAGASRRAGRGHASRQALPSRCVARGMLRSVLSLKARRCVERSRMATQRGDCPRGGGSARLAQARQRLLVRKGHSAEPPAVQSPCSYMYAGACRLPFGDEPHHFLTPVLAE